MRIFLTLPLLFAGDSKGESPARRCSGGGGGGGRGGGGQSLISQQLGLWLPPPTLSSFRLHIFSLFPEPLPNIITTSLHSYLPLPHISFLIHFSVCLSPPTAPLLCLQPLSTCSTVLFCFVLNLCPHLKTENTNLTTTVMWLGFFFFSPLSHSCLSCSEGAFLLASIARAGVLGYHGNSESNQAGPSDAKNCHGEEAATSRP